MKYGIMEEVNLSFTTTPSGLTANQVGGLQWEKTAGGGTLETESANGLGMYIAPDSADGNLRFKLEVVSGPSKGRGPTFDRTVVIPSGANLGQAPGTGIRHTMGKAGVGFKGIPFLEPKDVSFSQIRVREGETIGEGTGFLADDDGRPHEASGAIEVMSCNASSGCQLDTVDTVDSGDWSPQSPPSSPWGSGTFTWEIPLEYRNAQGDWVEFATWTHMATIDSNGKMTLSKGGLSFSRNWFDPTSSF